MRKAKRIVILFATIKINLAYRVLKFDMHCIIHKLLEQKISRLVSDGNFYLKIKLWCQNYVLIFHILKFSTISMCTRPHVQNLSIALIDRYNDSTTGTSYIFIWWFAAGLLIIDHFFIQNLYQIFINDIFYSQATTTTTKEKTQIITNFIKQFKFTKTFK